MNSEQMKVAHRMRTEDDASYADIAEKVGLEREDWHVVRDALKGYTPASAAPDTKLGALLANAEQRQAQRTLGDELGDHAAGEVARSGRDAPINDEDGAMVIRLYNTGQVSFDEIAEALDPPRHWLTVSTYLADHGWLRPGVKTPTYSTATPEGEARWQAEQQEIMRKAAAGEPVL